MIQPHFSQPAITSPFAPTNKSDLERTIGVLQQLQKLVVEPGTASLADAIQVVRDMQYDFGEDAQLESVIQILVGQHLAPQLAARRLARQQLHTETMEVFV